MATTQMQPTLTPANSPSSAIPDPRNLWHASAPATLVKPYQEAEPTGRWQVWKDYLANRKNTEPLAKRIPGSGPSLAWSLPAGLEKRDTAALIDRLAKLGKTKGKRARADSIGEELQCWLAEADGAVAEPGYALESLAWCHALPALVHHIEEALWWELLDHLCQTATAAAGIDLAHEPLAAQLLAGELASTLSYLLPEIKRCRQLTTTGRNALSGGLTELLDGEGIIEGKNLGVLRPLLACWTRSFYIGRDQKGGPFKRDGQVQYEWFVRTALRLTRADGTQALTSGAPSAWCKDLFEAAVEAGGDDTDEEVAELILPGKKPAKDAEDWCTPEAAMHSEWAELTVLRPEWSRNGPRLTIAYGGETMQAELEVGGDVLFSGTWAFELTLDGKPLTPTCEWEEICWMSDEDADYLELEIELTGDYRLQRQILVAREDECLYVADVVLGERPGRLEYRSTLPLVKQGPLGEGCRFEPAEENREGFLVGRRRRALVLPLALPEWRSDLRIGELQTTEAGLQLSQSAEAARTCAPLFIDLHPRRLTKASTWRQLTVAEEREIVPRDVAVGYRVQIGDEQWMFYRSLAERGNRTLLGHNLNEEFLAAWFHETGEVEPLVEIGD